MTETHVVIYCDGCGDVYTENTSESICFDSINQAVSYINTRSATIGWLYDGDLVRCDGCLATAYCTDHGHSFGDRHLPPRRLASRSTPVVRCCTVCDIPENEAQS
ncbi:hypothetical protein NBRGN_045_00520 [Nocardia brasiliensis NBRC 14402]|uniref:hypothetical protein n=1 Tax=Nocardia brasiliensis TaxID=37326 RepID=UPI00045D0C43|nr:hypothetical protein [Nocardia brasiliensis]GAJ81952.1 hypothetical protein NBRGN_045_00520 [Nocardia brasiliensis NBRC 14402]SUB55074.1 Uncharacterised protein [Nocardia brasiliensis]